MLLHTLEQLGAALLVRCAKKLAKWTMSQTAMQIRMCLRSHTRAQILTVNEARHSHTQAQILKVITCLRATPRVHHVFLADERISSHGAAHFFR
jgi:hypothetical protein